jgi:hypothetical protein
VPVSNAPNNKVYEIKQQLEATRNQVKALKESIAAFHLWVQRAKKGFKDIQKTMTTIEGLSKACGVSMESFFVPAEDKLVQLNQKLAQYDHISAGIDQTMTHFDKLSAQNGKKPGKIESFFPARALPVNGKTGGTTLAPPIGDKRLGKTQRMILTALAMFSPNPVSRTKVAFMASLSVKGGYYSNLISELKRAGFVDGIGQMVMITLSGKDALGSFTPLPTDPDELIDHWASAVGKAPGSMLRALQGHYPGFITRQELADSIGLSAGAGYFNNCLGNLRKLDLLEEQGNTLRISSEIYSQPEANAI